VFLQVLADDTTMAIVVIYLVTRWVQTEENLVTDWLGYNNNFSYEWN